MNADIVKTTIEIDEVKLDKVMKLGGFNTRKEAVDWALTEAVRIATLNHIKANPWTETEARMAVAEDYDVLAARQQYRQDPVKYTAPRRKKK
ncbi:MAG: type II toxin-antitoxin system VapB family antitoxin [Roseimicrobium sp.]